MTRCGVIGLGVSIPNVAARGGRGFAPGDLGAALLALWDAERTDRLNLAGANVSAWTDLVGGYAPAQAVSGSKPIWSATSFNGRPGVTFDGTDDELTLTGSPLPTGAAAGEIWMLCDQIATAADGLARCLFGYGGGTANARRIFRNIVTSANRAGVITGSGSAATTTNGSADFSGRHVVRAVIDGAVQVISLDEGAATSAAIVPATNTDRLRIGANVSASASQFGSACISLVAVTSLLTTDQASQFARYLKNRGAIA
jgi:hypothetical protein